MTVDEAMDELRELTAAMIQLETDLATQRATRDRLFIQRWHAAIPPDGGRDSTTFRNRAADYATFGFAGGEDYQTELLYMEAQQRANHFRRDYLNAVIGR